MTGFPRQDTNRKPGRKEAARKKYFQKEILPAQLRNIIGRSEVFFSREGDVIKKSQIYPKNPDLYLNPNPHQLIVIKKRIIVSDTIYIISRGVGSCRKKSNFLVVRPLRGG